MRTTETLIATAREIPKDARMISHQYMIRSGLIRQLASGIYTWLPIGMLVLQKIEGIVHDEMRKAGASEVKLPSILPAELLQETSRWKKFGSELLKIKDRYHRSFCYGPTHEEPMVEIARKEIKSYRQLPLNLYQIQTKFRDEIRPRFGVIRAREFIMKDAYSFHSKQECMEKTYIIMCQAYNNILKRIGLNFRIVEADSGDIGGNITHEFQILVKTGEDIICYSNQSAYAANIELAKYLKPDLSLRKEPTQKIKKVKEAHLKCIDPLSKKITSYNKEKLKILIIRDSCKKLFMLIINKEHTLNSLKVNKLSQIAPPFYLVKENEIKTIMGADLNFVGPVRCNIPIIVDYSAALISNFICGANENGYYYIGVNWKRDIQNFDVEDLRNVVTGDLSPDGIGQLQMTNGIEVGHIFQLGSHYSKIMNASVFDENNKKIPLIMGCYGLGITRIIAASIEQSHDEKGIIWPETIAPFNIIIIPLQMHTSVMVTKKSEDFYVQLKAYGFDVLLDDRQKRPGIMFADADLIGIPHQIIISDIQIKQGKIEYKSRKTGVIKKINCNLESILQCIVG